MTDANKTETPRGKRGFASMEKAKQRQIASLGGKAAHARGTAHVFSHVEAKAAGRKGGLARAAKGTGHRFTSATASLAGSKGGRAVRKKTGKSKEEGSAARDEQQ